MSSNRVQLSHEKLLATIGDRWSPAEITAAAELLAGGEGQFPSGIRSLPPDLVSAIQRERILAAALRATRELGYREMSVQDVLDRAGVSRPTFYEQFENKEDCFLTAFDAAAGELRKRVDAAVDATEEGSWRDRLRASLDELLRFVAEEPDAAATLIVEARAACPAALAHRDELFDHFTSRLDDTVRAELPAGSTPAAIAAAGVVGGIEALLYSRLNREEVGDLDALLPSLMYFAVLPYEGHEAAAEELAVPVA